jgi:hypothetical protein
MHDNVGVGGGLVRSDVVLRWLRLGEEKLPRARRRTRWRFGGSHGVEDARARTIIREAASAAAAQGARRRRRHRHVDTRPTLRQATRVQGGGVLALGPTLLSIRSGGGGSGGGACGVGFCRGQPQKSVRTRLRDWGVHCQRALHRRGLTVTASRSLDAKFRSGRRPAGA